MTHQSGNQLQRPKRPDSHPLLSVCTVLILSGFVLGIAMSSRMSGGLQAFVILSGLTGMLAFLGLDTAAHRRRRLIERREQQYVENRLVKHVDSQEFKLPAQPDHEELAAMARAVTEAIDLAPVPSDEPELTSATH